MTDIDYQSFIRAIDSGYHDLQKAAIAQLYLSGIAMLNQALNAAEKSP